MAGIKNKTIDAAYGRAKDHGSEAANSTLNTQHSTLPLSVYMITLNNGATIEKALQSVAGWAGELVIVDSHSTDGAIGIIEKYTDHVYQYDTFDQREKYQYAQDQCTHPWVLFIDADEWLTTEIKAEIEGIIARGTPYDGFIVDRRNIYLGREIKYGGWYPDEEIRLYRKEKGGWQGGIHAKVYVDGKVGRLKTHYMHTPYADTAHQIRTIDRYSAAFADDLYKAGRHFHLFPMVSRPLYRVLRDYIFKRGFLDGIPGMIIMASTMYYVFMKYAKLWEMEKKNGRNGHL
ncbi:MAG: glycosyltransferase family 2 protein [Syntrophus sp. (in: bacteria)]|nr:glycosyltransferase family 2 protein [Syntrophus sp. (in: bacteria)]